MAVRNPKEYDRPSVIWPLTGRPQGPPLQAEGVYPEAIRNTEALDCRLQGAALVAVRHNFEMPLLTNRHNFCMSLLADSHKGETAESIIYGMYIN